MKRTRHIILGSTPSTPPYDSQSTIPPQEWDSSVFFSNYRKVSCPQNHTPNQQTLTITSLSTSVTIATALLTSPWLVPAHYAAMLHQNKALPPQQDQIFDFTNRGYPDNLLEKASHRVESTAGHETLLRRNKSKTDRFTLVVTRNPRGNHDPMKVKVRDKRKETPVTSGHIRSHSC